MFGGIKTKAALAAAAIALISGMISGAAVLCIKSCAESKKCKKAFKQIENKLL